MPYQTTVGAMLYRFADLKTLLAKASPARSGDYLAGLAAATYEERMAAKLALADVPLQTFLNEALVPYETDEVTRLIIDSHSAQAFAPVASLTVGGFRDWLLSERAIERLSEGTALMQTVNKRMEDVHVSDRSLIWNTDLIETLELDNLMAQAVVTKRRIAAGACAGRA